MPPAYTVHGQVIVSRSRESERRLAALGSVLLYRINAEKTFSMHLAKKNMGRKCATLSIKECIDYVRWAWFWSLKYCNLKCKFYISGKLLKLDISIWWDALDFIPLQLFQIFCTVNFVQDHECLVSTLSNKSFYKSLSVLLSLFQSLCRAYVFFNPQNLVMNVEIHCFWFWIFYI